jgi:hypothetical protein
VVLGEPVFDTAAVAQELNGLRTAPTGADLPATLARVRELLAQTRQRVPRLTRRHVVVYSDMARNTWDPGRQAASDWRRVWEELAQSAAVELRDVGPRPASESSNLAIVALRYAAASDGAATRHDLQVGSEGRLEAVLRNFGSRETTATVEFQLDGRPLAAPTVTVPPRSEAVTTARVRFDALGDQVAMAALRAVRPPDSLRHDDQRWLVLPVRDRIEILCIEGGLDEARFLALAFAPGPRGPTASGDAQAIRVAVASETALLDRSLQRYDLIALCNVARFRESEADAIGDYVYRGGRLVVFPGDRTDVANYNQRLVDASKRLLPARLAAPLASDELRIDPRGYRDPLVELFRGQERAGLLSTPIWCYLPATVVDANTARVALAFHNGDPWFVHEPFGAGHVWLGTTAAAPRSRIAGSEPPRPWNAWATWPSFVPLAQTLLRESLAGRSTARNVLVGEALTGAFALDGNRSSSSEGPRLDEGSGDASLPQDDAVLIEFPTAGPSEASMVLEPVVAPESIQRRRIAAERSEHELRWILPAASIPGIYVALPRGSTAKTVEQRFAVNLDTLESDPQRIDGDDLPVGLKESLLAASQESVKGEGAKEGGAASGQGNPSRTAQAAAAEPAPRRWFRPLLVSIAGMLAAETLLAWRMGRRGGA